MNKSGIEYVVYDLARKANTCLRKDVLSLLKDAYRDESVPPAKKVLKVILDNARIAKKHGIAICQDTGLPIVFIEAGADVCIGRRFINDIHRGIRRAYTECGFRFSAVEPFSDRTRPDAGIVHIDFHRRYGLKITVFPKGFGSENKSRLKMFNPTDSFESIRDFVVEAVKEAGPAACPPFIIGIGIGGTSDVALLTAKKALLDKVDKPNPDKFLAEWEKKILDAVNDLKIGPMGMGGKFTALAVKIKTHTTHIAGLPVGVNISCHALRGATVTIKI